MDKQVEFEHKMAAHCESGTLTSLLNHAGLEISEPMVFGIASGILFGYIDNKNFTFPTIIVRTKPGQIRKNISKRLGIKFYQQHFKNINSGEKTLDDLISKGIPTAAQVDFFYMEYMPDWMRVHINVHFIVIYGINGNNYIVSDSYSPGASELSRELMRKARWAGGHMAPKGFLYYPADAPQNIDFKKPVISGIKLACRNMLHNPYPFVGIKGIYKFANKILTWPNLATDEDHLSTQIMRINILLEDQGTGGGGFRFMYATFLQKAAEILQNDNIANMSKRMMEIGDNWRNISYFSAKIGKAKDFSNENLNELSKLIQHCGDLEKSFFSDLKKEINKL